MDSISRFANDLSSWYWWLSVVFVGLAINLVSSYVKPPLDKWLDGRSSRRRLAREARDLEFDDKASKIAADPTLLTLANQKADQAETRTQLAFILIGVNLMLLFTVTSIPEPRSGMTTFLIVGLFALIPMHLLNLMKAMKGETVAEDLYRAARKKYKSGGSPLVPADA